MVHSANKPLILAVVGNLLIVVGILLCIFWPILIHRMTVKELTLTPTSQSFAIWNDSSRIIPLHMEIYFFNWTNPDELRVPGKKPNFVQLGPYTFLYVNVIKLPGLVARRVPYPSMINTVTMYTDNDPVILYPVRAEFNDHNFTEKREKVDVTFHPENNTVSYDQRRTWYFEANKSNGSLTDVVTQLNVVALSAAHKVRYWSSLAQVSMSLTAMAGVNDIHVTKTVDELLFTGYSDSMIDLGRMSSFIVDIPPFDKFGWFYERNGSTNFDGHFNMATGQDDIMKLGTLLNWNYGNATKYYDTPCNALEGSAGEFWPPERTKDQIALFSADICRPLIYEYDGISTYRGIDGYKYVIGEITLSNSTKRRYPHEQAKYFDTKIATTEEFFGIEHSSEFLDTPVNDYGEPDVIDVGQCYCSGDCIPSGLINVTTCRYGAPAFVSLPHFHKADPIYRDQVDGMDPVDDKHGFSITLEPKTGIPINVAARLQVNILLQPSPYISPFKDVPKIYFPMFWFNEYVGISEDLAFSLKMFLYLPSIGFYSSIAMVCLGSLMLITAGVLRYSYRRRNLPSNIKPQGVIPAPSDQKTELIYLDTNNLPDDDNQTRLDRQLYPKFIGDKENL